MTKKEFKELTGVANADATIEQAKEIEAEAIFVMGRAKGYEKFDRTLANMVKGIADKKYNLANDYRTMAEYIKSRQG